ncbi:MAG: YajQ family cyclic di-GMP-binding protein, partial [Acidobacteriota bacterium]
VCRVDLQEVKNAVQQARKEIGTRFDFKGSGTEIKLAGGELELTSTDELKLKSAYEVLRTRLVKRGVPLKALQPGKIESALGSTFRQRFGLQQGIPTENAREIVKMIKATKLKVQVAIQGDQLRVTGKKKDDLQAVVHVLKEKDMGIEMQFTNYR